MVFICGWIGKIYIVLKESTTSANQGAIVLIDQAANHGRLRSVLYDWGYTETEIHRFLNENEMSEPIQDSLNEPSAEFYTVNGATALA